MRCYLSGCNRIAGCVQLSFLVRQLGALALASICLTPALAQSSLPQDTTPSPRPGVRAGSQDMAPSEQELRIRHSMEVERQRQRYEQIQKDSQRLLELATELKHYVDKAGVSVLSVEVIRKAEELEKLSRRVKENMRGE